MAAASGILFSFPINWENMLNHCYAFHKFCEIAKAYSTVFLYFEFYVVHDAMKRVELKEFICNRFVM